MKFSESWLREWVDPALSTAELAEQMTLMGLEIDSFESAMPAVSGVLVAEIQSVQPHPDADSLQLCLVEFGGEAPVEVVCGAANAAAGLKVPMATVGARLPDGTRIRKTRLRGVQSHGMLCSAAELQLAADADGLLELPADATVGQAIEQYLQLDDNILEVELTPNRGDCLSIRGLARDVCARNDLDLRSWTVEPPAVAISDQMNVEVAPGNACARYTGRVIRDISLRSAAAPLRSPLWLTERLRRSGIRTINPAVDITNYVMLELGQPMHAFDLDKVSGNIRVRLAHSGEKLTLLDGREMVLDDDITVIADDSGAIGIAGIMGGLSTAVDENTTAIFFESALFLPEGVAGKAWRLDAHTDSSHRFERGVDPARQLEALEYASTLLLDICGGRSGPVSDWVSSAGLPQGSALQLRSERIVRLLGKALDASEVESILRRLDVQLEANDAGWIVTPPSHRYDLRIEEDYIEELARIHGYDNIPRSSSNFRPRFSPVSETEVSLDSLKNQLVARGYQEVVTYSFVDDELQRQICPQQPAIALSNPISSDLGVMRTSTLPGLLGVMQRNLKRQNNDLRVFESGLRYTLQGDEIKQEMVLGALICGRRYPEHWQHSDEQVDFFDLKGDLTALFQRANAQQWELRAGSQTFLHPGRSADIWSDGNNIGWIGQLHPELQNSLDVSQTALMFEVKVAEIHRVRVPEHREISRYPGVRRDIAVVVPESVSSGDLEASIRKNGPDFLQKIVTFDVYSGDKVDSGMKSVALGLILQEFSRTLEESEIDKAMQHILDSLNREVGAILRV